MLSSTSYAILGLLSLAPMSGYDLRGAAERTIGHFWPISKSKVYVELQRLEQRGLIESTEVTQARYPDKRVYRLTTAGEDALDSWLDSTPAEDAVLRLPFLLRVLFGHRRPADTTRFVIDDVAATATAQATAFADYAAALNSVPDAAYAALVVDCGARIAAAIAAWADEARSRVPDDVRINARRARSKQGAALITAAPQPPTRRQPQKNNDA
ncbi:MAG: PadR family transcriptional regulator [Actinomycetota bacterium]|nr:PadR family transcriptional regulator [Actinomycetota bacterium]